jgi:glycosyltransferase involved in cell wall biosynthesis
MSAADCSHHRPMIDVMSSDLTRYQASAGKSLKILLWTSVPTHHQAALLYALRRQGADIVVHYLSRVPVSRQKLGWRVPAELPQGESYVDAHISSIWKCRDWRTRIHVIPGCGSGFLFALAAFLSVANVAWVNWSEPSNPQKSRQIFKQALRRLYALLNNTRGLGSLAIGTLAADDFARWGINPGRVLYLPYSIAPVPVAPRHVENSPTRAHMRFLFLGALCERKGIDVLLRAFAIVHAADNRALLTLVGRDDSEGAYVELARLLGIFGCAVFFPSIDADKIGHVLEQCDVLVLPSRFDGWGMALSEGASAGKALIATEACGAAHHLIEDGVSGYRIPPDDVAALADRMLRYCREPELAVAHGIRAANRFTDVSPERNAARMIRSLEILIALNR